MLPQPRVYHGAYFLGPKHVSRIGKTWVEAEEFAYPAGGFTRRFYAICEDGILRVGLCSIPDTYFSIPAKIRIYGKVINGVLMTDTETHEYVFHAYKGQ